MRFSPHDELPLRELDSHLDRSRLLRLMDELALFGARPDRGVDRQALTAADFESRRFLIDHAASAGLGIYRDRMANLFFRLEGRNPGLPPVLIGSHSDSQPTGGRFDGAFGVCAALEVMQALRSAGLVFERSIETVVWTNEEGCRFAPGSMGAISFVDPDRFGSFLDARDAAGKTVAEELAVHDRLFADIELRPFALPLHAFVELHIEQGPVLEQVARPIGLVRGVQGTRWFRAAVSGQAAHAGCTPRDRRSDAFRKAVAFASRVYELFDAGDDDLRLTIGEVSVRPGAVNVIPDDVTLSIDLRHPDPQHLDRIEQRLREMAGTEVSLTKTMEIAPLEFSAEIRGLIAEVAEELGIDGHELNSGAFHDAVHLARHCPTAMIFVPSRDGISHNPQEYTAPDDLFAGTRVLAGTALRLLTGPAAG